MPATPSVSISPASSAPFIGASQVLTLSFNNTGSQAGYSPYLLVNLPRGADGNDGESFASATYLGAGLSPIFLTYDLFGHATNPLTGLVVNGVPGATGVILQLPFGSFAPGQTPADVVLTLNTSSLADVNTALPVTVTSGFANGVTPLNDPATDPAVTGATSTANITPVIATLTKTYLGPEQETATGPSYPHTWEVRGEVAAGQTVSNYVIIDTLPNGAVINGPITSSGAGGASITTVLNANGTTTVTATFANPVVGGVDHPTIDIPFYINQAGTGGGPILGALDGAFHLESNSANYTGFWTPTDPRDAPGAITGAAPAINDITAKSIAEQKSVAVVEGGYATPGKHLEYTLAGEVSNYFSVGNLRLVDSMGDGQRFDTAFTPTITFTEGGASFTGSLLASEYSVSRSGTTGISTIIVDVAAAGLRLGIGATLDGAPGGTPSPATATVTFRSVIEPSFVSTQIGDQMVDQGDTLANSVVFSGTTPNGSPISDNSAASVTLPTNIVGKSVYAINGVLVSGPQIIQAGDDVTYRITLDLPLTHSHSVMLRDFLPLPVFNALDPDANGSANGFTFTVGAPSAAAPLVNFAKLGPTDTTQAAILGSGGAQLNPIITSIAGSNAVNFNFGSVLDNYAASKIDLLFTVRVNDAAFGDNVLLTNQVTEMETNSAGVVSQDNAIVQFLLTEPKLAITKGVVATNDAGAVFTAGIGPAGASFAAPGGNGFTGTINSNTLAASPVNANLVNAQAGDLVKFAIILDNQGHGPKGAFDVAIQDTLPPGFVIPPGGLHLTVQYGDGTLVPYTLSPNGFFGPAGGITLTNASGTQGSIAADSATSGRDIVVVTYDLQLISTVQPTQTLSNTATTAHYAALPGGVDRVPTDGLPDSDPAYVQVAAPQISKALIATSLPQTTGSNLAIGETATFHITVTIPLGVSRGLVLQDLLPGGAGSGSAGVLEYLSVNNITKGAQLSGASLTSGLASSVASDSNGDTYLDLLTFTLGDVTNTAGVIGGAGSQISFDVTARVKDLPANYAGLGEFNTASYSILDPNNPGGRTGGSATAPVTIVEPHLVLNKGVDNPNATAGMDVHYTITLKNLATGNGDGPAFNASITDLLTGLPANIIYDPATVVVTGGTGSITTNANFGTGVTTSVQELDPGQTLTLTFTGHVQADAVAGDVVKNTATSTAGSIPGGPDTRTYPGTASAEVQLITPGTGKYLVATSDLTNGANIAVGEIGTYRIVVDVPGGTSQAFTINDILPDASSGRLVYVPGSVSVIGVGSTGATTSPAITLSDPNGNGINEKLALGFGTLVTPVHIPGNAAYQIIVEFKAQLTDLPSNQPGATLTNQAYTTIVDSLGNTITGSTSTAPVNTVQPLLDISKSTPFTTGDAGDIVTYTVVVQHDAASSSTAYHLAIADTLPGALSLIAGSVTSSFGTASSSGNTITVTSPGPYLLGAVPITITYQARLVDAVFNGQTIPNTATLDYSTEPTDGRPLSGQDDAVVSVVLTDALSKVQVSSSLAGTTGTDLAPGETATYQITATLGEGTQLLTLADALPAGMILVSAKVLSIGASITNSAGLVVGSGPTSGTSFNFGTVVNHGDNMSNAGDTIVLEYVTRVAAGTAAGSTLTDTASLTASTPGGTAMPTITKTVTDTVVAPVLAITKATPFTTGDAGDVATYTITISHTGASTAAAYNVSLGDLIPAGLVLVGAPTTTAGTLTVPGGNSLALSLSQYNLGAAPIIITYQAKLADNVINGQHITNTANLGYSSAPANGTPGTGQASASEDVVITDTLVKAITATSYPLTAGTSVGFGETITYTLTATLAEGAQGLVLADAMPAGLTYLSSTVLSLGNVTGSAIGVGGSGSYTPGTNTVSFNFGNIINPGDNLTNAGDTIVVQVVAQVAPGTLAGTSLTNTGTLTPGTPTNTPFTGTPPGGSTSTQTVTVVSATTVNGTVGLDAPFFCCGTQATAVFEGVTVNLLNNLGQIVASTMTDALGHYTLAGITDGTYSTQFVAPSGLVFAPIGSPGLQGVVNDANAAGVTAPFAVAGTPVSGIDAGLLYNPTVGLTGNAPTYLPNGGGTYNFDGTGAYAIGGTGGGYVLNGNGGLPYLVGGTGNNVLHGGNGNGSILVGGPGQNIFEGTPGVDIILFCCGGGNGQGLGGNGQGLGSNGQGLGGASGGLFNGNACFNFDLMVGGRDRDIIEGNDGRVTALGGAGNDEIHAQGLIVAGSNTGTITSLGGGNFGNYTVGDTIKIGNGQTNVVYQLGDGVQYIENFNPGRGDVIDIYGYGAPTATGLVNGQYVLYFGANAAIVLNGYQPQNGPLTGVVYHPTETSMPGAFGHFTPLPPVVLPTSQTSFYGTQGDDIAIGSAAGTVFHGNGGNDLLVGGNGNNVFYGEGGNNSLYGGSGTDIFYLSGGSNFVSGCGGNDVAVFAVPQGQATVVQNPDGTTSVTTAAGTTILKGVEAIRFSDATVNLTGGALPPILAGSAGPDSFSVTDAATIILDPFNGDNDQAHVSVNGWTASANIEVARLSGGATSITGNDTGIQLVANPILASMLVGGAGNDVFWGGLGADTMIGGAGDDIFRPGPGAASMSGGLGHDQYVISNAAQVVNELPGGGIDTAWVTVNGWTVADNVEIVRLAGAGITVNLGSSGAQVVADGSGSTITAAAGDNVFWSSGGNDAFIGGAGNDVFYGATTGISSVTGGAGNDSYVIKSLGTTISEAANGGYDTAYISISNYVLSANVEEGRLGGTATTLTGAGTANQLVANATLGSTLIAGSGTSGLWGSNFDDTMVVGSANEKLYLLGGADTIQVQVAHWGIDEVADFSGGWAGGDGDRLRFLAGSGVTGMGDLAITDFGSKTLVAHGADQIILYGVGSLTHTLSAGDLLFA